MKFYMIVENEKNISLQQKVKQLSKALMTAGFVANPLMMMNLKYGEKYIRDFCLVISHLVKQLNIPMQQVQTGQWECCMQNIHVGTKN